MSFQNIPDAKMAVWVSYYFTLIRNSREKIEYLVDYGSLFGFYDLVRCFIRLLYLGEKSGFPILKMTKLY